MCSPRQCSEPFVRIWLCRLPNAKNGCYGGMLTRRCDMTSPVSAKSSCASPLSTPPSPSCALSPLSPRSAAEETPSASMRSNASFARCRATCFFSRGQASLRLSTSILLPLKPQGDDTVRHICVDKSFSFKHVMRLSRRIICKARSFNINAQFAPVVGGPTAITMEGISSSRSDAFQHELWIPNFYHG